MSSLEASCLAAMHSWRSKFKFYYLHNIIISAVVNVSKQKDDIIIMLTYNCALHFYDIDTCNISCI